MVDTVSMQSGPGRTRRETVLVGRTVQRAEGVGQRQETQPLANRRRDWIREAVGPLVDGRLHLAPQPALCDPTRERIHGHETTGVHALALEPCANAVWKFIKIPRCRRR